MDGNPVETIAAVQRINNNPAVVMVWSVDLRDISRIKYFVEKREGGGQQYLLDTETLNQD